MTEVFVFSTAWASLHCRDGCKRALRALKVLIDFSSWPPLAYYSKLDDAGPKLDWSTAGTSRPTSTWLVSAGLGSPCFEQVSVAYKATVCCLEARQDQTRVQRRPALTDITPITCMTCFASQILGCVKLLLRR